MLLCLSLQGCEPQDMGADGEGAVAAEVAVSRHREEQRSRFYFAQS